MVLRWSTDAALTAISWESLGKFREVGVGVVVVVVIVGDVVVVSGGVGTFTTNNTSLSNTFDNHSLSFSP